MKIRLKTIKKAAISWYDNDPFSQAAAISYYTIFSFPALAFIYLSLASIFTTRENLQDQLTNYFSNITGPQNAQNFLDIIDKTAPTHTNFWALAAGMVILLFAGLKLFLQLQKTLNMIWRVKVSEHVNIWDLVKQRIMAFSVMLGILFMMLATLFITTIITALSDFITQRLSEHLLFLITTINFFISLSLITILFTILLRLLPDAEIHTKYAAAGGLASALLFIIGQQLIGIYFALAEPASAYGVTASIILLMLWVSYTCVILLFGAELSKALQEDNGTATKANHLAVKATHHKKHLS